MINEEERQITKSAEPFRIDIGEDEGEFVPHFHLKINGKDTCIRIDEETYFLHGCHKDKLNSSEKKWLYSWMKLKPTAKMLPDIEGKKPINNWENIRNSWNVINPKGFIDVKNIPNYLKLERDYRETI